ncbi:type II secretion system protein [Candidatus Woesebacteria bacterium]|nr:MAG: type II secretion system protein [Candidatus Woesebacteria bacterium]
MLNKSTKYPQAKIEGVLSSHVNSKHVLLRNSNLNFHSSDKYKKVNGGFSLMEILIVIALISVLSTVMIIVINPQRQFAKSRDFERESDLIGILSSVQQYAAEHSGELPDTDNDPETSSFPTEATCIGTGVGCFDLAGAGEAGEEIVPVYMVSMPFDPRTGDAEDTAYMIHVDANGHLVGLAVGETKEEISVSK